MELIPYLRTPPVFSRARQSPRHEPNHAQEERLRAGGGMAAAATGNNHGVSLAGVGGKRGRELVTRVGDGYGSSVILYDCKTHSREPALPACPRVIPPIIPMVWSCRMLASLLSGREPRLIVPAAGRHSGRDRSSFSFLLRWDIIMPCCPSRSCSRPYNTTTA